MSDFNTIKNLYEDGYRCIYYDNHYVRYYHSLIQL